MQEHGVRRIIWESSLGVGETRGQLGPLYNWLLIPLLLRHAFADKERQEAIIRATSLEWTIVQPAALTNGPRTGTYRVGACAGRFFPTVSRADVAHFMIEELENPRHVRQVVLFAIDVDRRHARIPVGPRDRLEPLGIKADGRQRGGDRG